MSFKQRSADEVQELAVALFEEHGGYLMAIATRNAGGSVPVGEEALQEAMISFLGAFDPGRGAPPLAWLTLTLKRECWRRYGRERFDRRVGWEIGEEEPGTMLEQLPAPGEGLEDRLGGLHEGRHRWAVFAPTSGPAWGSSPRASPTRRSPRGRVGAIRRSIGASGADEQHWRRERLNPTPTVEPGKATVLDPLMARETLRRPSQSLAERPNVAGGDRAKRTRPPPAVGLSLWRDPRRQRAFRSPAF